MSFARLVVIAIAAVINPSVATAQVSLASSTPATVRCDGGEIAERLRREHPMHVAGGAAPCSEWGVWVAAKPLDRAQRSAWIQISRMLLDVEDSGCRGAGRLLERIERVGRAMTWQAPDTSGGLVYFGATFVDANNTPLAIQLWEPAFDRPLPWLAAALSHEAFHALAPNGTEADAMAFGERCGALASTRAAVRLTTAQTTEQFRRFLGPGAKR